MRHSHVCSGFQTQTRTLIAPLGEARSALPGCSPRRTSCPGSDARSSRGFSASYLPAVCGRTCTAPPVCTAGTQRHTAIRSLKGFRSETQGHGVKIQAIGALAGYVQQNNTQASINLFTLHQSLLKDMQQLGRVRSCRQFMGSSGIGES